MAEANTDERNGVGLVYIVWYRNFPKKEHDMWTLWIRRRFVYRYFYTQHIFANK